MAIFLEESGNLKCIRYANARWLGNVADALDITISLKEGGSFEELRRWFTISKILEATPDDTATISDGCVKIGRNY